MWGVKITTKARKTLTMVFTIYHQGFFHSVRRNPSLNCLHRRRSLAILGHEGPRWWIRLSLHLVLGLPCRLFHSRGVHSVTLFVHLLSLTRAMCPAHPCIPFLITSMISFTPVWCRIQVLRLWSRRVMPSMMRSILRCATDSSSMWAFFSAHVSLPYTMTGNTYSLCTFLFTFILAFLLFMMLATLLNAAHPSAMRLLISGRRSPACVTVLPRYTYRSTFSMVFPSTATVDVVALDDVKEWTGINGPGWSWMRWRSSQWIGVNLNDIKI